MNPAFLNPIRFFQPNLYTMSKLTPKGEYNNLTPQMQDKVTPLKKGDFVTYRLPVPLFQDNIRDNEGNLIYKKNNTYTWAQSVQIPTQDEILDTDGTYKKIGVIRNYNPKTEEYDFFPFTVQAQSEGYFTVNSGHTESERFYPFFELTDFNGSKPNRDTSKPIYFYRVDQKADARTKARQIDTLTEELVYVKDATKEELLTFAYALLWDIGGKEVEDIRNDLKVYVRENEGKLTELFKNKDSLANKALIQQGINAGIVQYNALENKFVYTKTGKDIATFTRIEDKDPVDQFADWIATHKDGDKTKQAIKSFLKNE